MLHRLFRLLLLNIFVPVYEGALRLKFSDIRIIVRNSALSKQDYHFLLSDLDLAFVGDINDKAAENLRLLHKRMKHFLLFLGEVEIYTKADWENRQNLLQELSPHFEEFRVLRKSQWLKRYLSESKNVLGKLRAKRGLRKCLAQMKAADPSPKELSVHAQKATGKLINKWNLTDIDFQVEADSKFFHPWLECSIHASEIELSPKEAVLAAAIFPVQDYGNESINTNVSIAREIPQIKSYLTRFSQVEFLMMRASVWGEKQIPDWYLANEPDLLHWTGGGNV